MLIDNTKILSSLKPQLYKKKKKKKNSIAYDHILVQQKDLKKTKELEHSYTSYYLRLFSGHGSIYMSFIFMFPWQFVGLLHNVKLLVNYVTFLN